MLMEARGVGPPGPRVIDGYEPTEIEHWELNLGGKPLQKQYTLLNVEPSLQPLPIYLFIYYPFFSDLICFPVEFM